MQCVESQSTFQKNWLPPSSGSVGFQWIIQHYAPEDRTLQNHHCCEPQTLDSLVYSLTLEMETVHFSQRPENVYQTDNSAFLYSLTTTSLKNFIHLLILPRDTFDGDLKSSFFYRM
jgi:hypothetical protein